MQEKALLLAAEPRTVPGPCQHRKQCRLSALVKILAAVSVASVWYYAYPSGRGVVYTSRAGFLLIC